MGLDLCHNSERERSYFERAKVHFAFKISFWMCADFLFCACNVSLACSPDARPQCSQNADGSLAQQHNPALQYAIIPDWLL